MGFTTLKSPYPSKFFLQNYCQFLSLYGKVPLPFAVFLIANMAPFLSDEYPSILRNDFV